MAPHPVPRPEVRYRIQNVDFGTFLERRNGTNTILRAIKDSLPQQWFFKEISSGIFEILNAEDKSYLLDASYPGPGYTLETKRAGTTQRSQWKLISLGSNEFYILNTNSGTNNILLYSESDSLPKLVEDLSITPNTTITKDDDYQWRILEDSPASLPDDKGMYLIQTLKEFAAVHPEAAVGGTQKVSIENQTLGGHHVWGIDDLGNGICTIMNIGDDTYLDVQRVGANGDWTPVLSSTTPVPQWTVKKAGDATYSIIIERHGTVNFTPTSTWLALTVKNNEIGAEELNGSYTQLWYIEPTNGIFSQPQPQTPQPQPQPQTPQPQVPEIIWGVPPGEYFLQFENGWYASYVSTWGLILQQTQPESFTIELAPGYPPGSGKCLIKRTSNGYYAKVNTLFGVGPYKDLGFNLPGDVWSLEAASAGPPQRFNIFTPDRELLITILTNQLSTGRVNVRRLSDAGTVGHSWALIRK